MKKHRIHLRLLVVIVGSFNILIANVTDDELSDGGTVIPPKEPTSPSILSCYLCQYGTNNEGQTGQFCNKTVKPCDEDEPNCISYYYTYKNNTKVIGKGCGKNNECKNTTKTCEDFQKKNQHFSTCTISCCQEPLCNKRSTPRHDLYGFVVTVYLFISAIF